MRKSQFSTGVDKPEAQNGSWGKRNQLARARHWAGEWRWRGLLTAKAWFITECETGVLGSFLVLVSLESGQRTKLTDPQGPIAGNSGPGISPDGSLLVFTRFRQFGASDIFLQRLVDGFKPAGEPRRITSPPGQFQMPLFLPNGRELVYRASHSKNGSGLFRMPVDNPSAAVSMGLPEGGMAAVSRDGTRLAYQYSDGPIAKISRLTLENGKGREAVPLLTSSRHNQSPQYSPDGRESLSNRRVAGIARSGSPTRMGQGQYR